MLPTHTVRVPESAEDSIQAAEGMAYPPRRQDGGHASSSEHSSLQSRLFGPGGVTNLTVQAQTSYSDAVPAQPHARATAHSKGEVSKSRWNTWEFYLYGLVFATVVPVMCWVPISLSQASKKNYPLYASHLRPGWLFGRMRDDSDFQYKTFRDNVPVLSLVLVVYLVVSVGVERLGRRSSYEPIHPVLTRPNRKVFLSFFICIFVLALHGTNSLKLLLACLINFALVKTLSSTSFAPITPLVVWTWNIASLFAVHWNNGFSYGSMSESLEWMDSYTGLLPRWQINFNITMLRLISFSMDCYWARQVHTPPKDLTEEELSLIKSDPRKRQETALPPSNYSLHNYLIYALYPPLFIAGPIMGFNDFTRQLHSPLAISPRYTIQYAIRLAATMLTMEFILHFMYVNAIKDAKAWHGSTPMELSMIGFWNLIVVWLKLLIPWRFFRLWALADGVDAPENMIRCMANNYSTLGFWRSWHRSYNLWIVRYIYIPVGGSSNAIAATLLVFTFVALWHDLSLKLLAWGWLVTLFILPEITARQIVSKARCGDQWWYRHVCAMGGVVNVLMMMSANLVGFAIGTDGMAYMWQQLLSSWHGLRFMVSACAVLFVGVQVMFEYREEELRRGTVRKC